MGEIQKKNDHARYAESLRASSPELIQCLQADDMEGAIAIIQHINLGREHTLYQEVGRLTRALHNALKDFHLEIGLDGRLDVSNELSEMVDARSRLNYVIEMTEEAANTTMDNVDSASPRVQRLIERCDQVQELWAKERASSDDSEYSAVSRLLGMISSESKHVQQHLQNILLAQGFQDLSGQVIRRVINLVRDVEESLVRLVKLASEVEQAAGIDSVALTEVHRKETNVSEEGPYVEGVSRGDVVNDQDEVDELLSSLGF
jgi:chemotaxis protein CheZ